MSNETQMNRPLIDIGWVLDGHFDTEILAVIDESCELLQQYLNDTFPIFQWRLNIPRSPQRTLASRTSAAQASSLLLDGLTLIEQKRWDFAFVLTANQLVSHSRSPAVAMPSRSLGVAVISVNELLTDFWRQGESSTASQQAAKRLKALYIHLIGDLNGIAHSNDPKDYFHYPHRQEGLGVMDYLSAASIEALTQELVDVADTRLEERPDYTLASRPIRYLKGIVHLRAEILSGIVQAQPWEFPFKLSSLSTAAISTLLILTMTAETWELGMSQEILWMSVFSLFAFLFSSLYVLIKQKLVLGRTGPVLTESRFIANATIIMIVLVGMAITYLLLIVLSLVLSMSLFSTALLNSWAPSMSEEPGFDRYFVVAQLVASFGLLIGSLGSSFEGQSYFRHVAFVDEEL